MTKEQEEAIKRLKRELNNLEYTKDLDIASDNYFGQFEGRINTIKTVLSMLEEKDEQIELMAKFIAQTEIDEFICKDIEYCIADDEYSNCYRCIKQYFENKVKER